MRISIAGIDGCGKSTQVGLVRDALKADYIQEIFPSRWGKLLRGSESPSLAQQLAWFTADRAVIASTLEAAAGNPDHHLVSDRSYLSGVAYQSYDSVLPPVFLEEMNRAIVPEYDLQIVLNVPIETAFARIEARGHEGGQRAPLRSRGLLCVVRRGEAVARRPRFRSGYPGRAAPTGCPSTGPPPDRPRPRGRESRCGRPPSDRQGDKHPGFRGKPIRGREEPPSATQHDVRGECAVGIGGTTYVGGSSAPTDCQWMGCGCRSDSHRRSLWRLMCGKRLGVTDWSQRCPLCTPDES